MKFSFMIRYLSFSYLHLRKRIIGIWVSQLFVSWNLLAFPADGTFVVDEHPTELTQDLRALWRFDSADSGILRDWSYLGANNPLDLPLYTLTGPDQPSGHEWQDGDLGNGAYRFPQSGTGFFYSVLENSGSGFASQISERFNFTGDFTIAIHVKLDEQLVLDNTRWHRLISTRSAFRLDQGFEWEYNLKNDELKFSGVNSEQLSLQGLGLADGQWHWLVLTLKHSIPGDPTSSLIPTIYVDGTAYDTSHPSLNVFSDLPHRRDGGPNPETLVVSGEMKALVPYDIASGEKARIAIGNQGRLWGESEAIFDDKVRQFRGEMKEMRVYGKALTAAQVEDLMRPLGPYWWYDYGAVDPRLFVDDAAPATLGQLKQMAFASRNYLDTLFPEISGISGSFTDTIDNFDTVLPPGETDLAAYYQGINRALVNVGQAKYLTSLQYDFLDTIGYNPEWFSIAGFSLTQSLDTATNNPWTATTAISSDYEVAQIGQLKSLFFYEFEAYLSSDTDGDRLLDYYEHFDGGQNGGLLPNTFDTDGDGLGDGFEVAFGIDAKSPEPVGSPFYAGSDADGDGLTTSLEAALFYGLDPSFTITWDPNSPNSGLEKDSDGDGALDYWELLTYGNLNVLTLANPTPANDHPDNPRDGDGIPAYKDVRPNDPSLGALVLTILIN